ncbi:hypothetical protein KL925_004690 [Ogataea polymorpha]|uniref:uncharacterized protein n=1 Tax=Ogataea polymorpha TaxID=460523 RepID=UPI0007F4FB08|nr:uncharacterized protein OGAPODRAFT_10644 [Ogataea polymorpha]KAG7878105.1 hypothetical protein KL937_004253 [Ogataea polymorpha]KAG7896465.1 hypothetical protein KL908_000979 [Ogataea polymorpha]KAG7906430.1 hypothetical protein KL906_004522 [Ogataea polymorpha]KAG7925213.1 hypothetical protein KL925_004690 [Ogataea polymorpha]KAG7932568.1 hypothetical protein KL904_004359 [Ogataea polymorpha]
MSANLVAEPKVNSFEFVNPEDTYAYREINLESSIFNEAGESLSPSLIIGRASHKGEKSERQERQDNFLVNDAAVSANHILGYVTPVSDSEKSAIYIKDVSQHGSYLLRYGTSDALRLKKNGGRIMLRNGDIIGLVVLGKCRVDDPFEIFRCTKVQFQVVTDYRTRLRAVRLNRNEYMKLASEKPEEDLWDWTFTNLTKNEVAFGGLKNEHLEALCDMCKTSEPRIIESRYIDIDPEDFHEEVSDSGSEMERGCAEHETGFWVHGLSDSDSEETPSEEFDSDHIVELVCEESCNLFSSNEQDSDSAPEEEAILKEVIAEHVEIASEPEKEPEIKIESDMEERSCRKRSISDAAVTVYEIQEQEPVKKTKKVQAKPFLAGLAFGSALTFGALSVFGSYIE